MTEKQSDTITVYGRPGCAGVPSVKALLEEFGVGYDYVDIRQNYEDAARLRAITGGHESVPTVVLPDGRALVEPGVFALRRALEEAGLGRKTGGGATLLAGLRNPVFWVFTLIGLGLAVAIWLSQSQ